MDPRSVHAELGPVQGWVLGGDRVFDLRELGYFQNQTEHGNNNIE